MHYTLIRLDHLNKSNATQIEANIEAVTFAELDKAKDTGSRLATVTRELHRGELFLITEAPRTPLFTSTEGSLEVTDSHSVTLPSEAIQNAKQRVSPARLAVASTGTPTSTENLHPADESTTVTQEEVTTQQRNDQTPYYYNIEIACPTSKAARYAPGTFNLGATEDEAKKVLVLKSTALDNAWYSVQCTCDESKKLFYKPNGAADSNLGIQPVKLSTRSAVSDAKEAYIPVTPAVQVNERLGFPTKGYFYHFHGSVLIHEYKIDDNKCTFNITHSRAGNIIDGVKFPKSQHCILLFWRIDGKEVNDQYLLYKKEQLTTTDLAEMTEDWLQENGFEVDVRALLQIRSESIVEHKTGKTHKVVSGDNLTTIAKKHGATVSKLKELNPAFADPRKLRIGAFLRLPDDPTNVPTVSPEAAQRQENAWYDYHDHIYATDVLAFKKNLADTNIVVVTIPKEWEAIIRSDEFIEAYKNHFTEFHNSAGTKPNTRSLSNLTSVIEEINKYYKQRQRVPNLYALSYMFATAQHESYDFTKRHYFSTRGEIGTDDYFDMYDPIKAKDAALRTRAISMGNTVEGDGLRYKGRGLVQLTWKDNYAQLGRKLGINAVANPELVSKYCNAVPILIWGVEDAIFNPARKGFNAFLSNGRPDYYNARELINGDKNTHVKGSSPSITKGTLITNYALLFEKILEKTSYTTR